ncbi:MAG TPA: hypothetical protein VGI81_05655 [Tepidisphaeraceae bacterium]|jgi:hypothetical protein
MAKRQKVDCATGSADAESTNQSDYKVVATKQDFEPSPAASTTIPRSRRRHEHPFHMNCIASTIRWLFKPMPSPTAGGAILWWEARRIPVNLLVGVYGIPCLLISLAFIMQFHFLQSGGEVIALIAIFLTAVEFNVCYTLGWLVEAPVRVLFPKLTPKFSPRLLLIGLLVSVFVITLPLLFPAILADGKTDRYTATRPATADLVGTYYPTPETLSLVTATGAYASGPCSIQLQSDGKFQFVNIPDWYRTDFGKPSGGMDSGTGVWITEKRQERWVLLLWFDNTDGFSYAAGPGLSGAEVELLGQHAPYDIALIVGDPDEGREMRFSRAPATTRSSATGR